MYLIFAFFMGAAAMARFDQGKTSSALFLAVVTVTLIAGQCVRAVAASRSENKNP